MTNDFLCKHPHLTEFTERYFNLSMFVVYVHTCLHAPILVSSGASNRRVYTSHGAHDEVTVPKLAIEVVIVLKRKPVVAFHVTCFEISKISQKYPKNLRLLAKILSPFLNQRA